jgi:hypothetical protein
MTSLYQSPDHPHSPSPWINRSPQLLYTPPSLSFNARTATAVCHWIDGYVSFANIEGLGAPPKTDDEDEEIGHRPHWLRWFWLKQMIVNSTYGTSAQV